ncbi:hypothetical protein Pelo_5571 [Pelomyxa schiedti]|nr:hypothetical protein Pelo_5571 [Pelomyxa schiedti]
MCTAVLIGNGFSANVLDLQFSENPTEDLRKCVAYQPLLIMLLLNCSDLSHHQVPLIHAIKSSSQLKQLSPKEYLKSKCRDRLGQNNVNYIATMCNCNPWHVQIIFGNTEAQKTHISLYKYPTPLVWNIEPVSNAFCNAKLHMRHFEDTMLKVVELGTTKSELVTSISGGAG